MPKSLISYRLRLPAEPSDPACALPRIDEYLKVVREMNEADCKRKVELFSSQGSMCVMYLITKNRVDIQSFDRCAGDLEDTMMDEYVDFCEKALLPESEVDGERMKEHIEWKADVK